MPMLTHDLPCCSIVTTCYVVSISFLPSHIPMSSCTQSTIFSRYSLFFWYITKVFTHKRNQPCVTKSHTSHTQNLLESLLLINPVLQYKQTTREFIFLDSVQHSKKKGILYCFCSPCVTVSLGMELSLSELEQALECSTCTAMVSMACLTTISAFPVTSCHLL